MSFTLVASALLGLAILVGYLAVAVRPRVSRRMRQAIALDEQMGAASDADLRQRAPVDPQKLLAIAEGFLGRLRPGSAGAVDPELARDLRWAGITMQPSVWQTLPYPLAVVGAVLGAAMGAVSGHLIVPTFVGALLGFFGPAGFLRLRLSRRTARIASEILTYTEYLAMAMKAGADFRIAIVEVGERFPGPISEAFQVALVGANLAGRLDDGLRSVRRELANEDAAALIDVLRRNLNLGAECADMLLAQTKALRAQRAAKVKERAGKMNTTLILLMGIFVLPPIFLILVGPTFSQALKFMSGTG